MLPVKLKWKNHIFLSSEHIYVYELLKWHGKLNTSTLQMLLNCSSGFKAKELGKKLVPEKSRSWMKVCVSKMYSILQAKCSQSKLYPEDSDLLDSCNSITYNIFASETETNESSLPIAPLNSTASLLHDLPEKSLQTVHQNQSQIALARDAVENKRVELIAHMFSFIVQSHNKKTYSVQLFPKEKCNCPSTTICWHIIASKLSLGILNIGQGKCTINLSQLKRNSRTKLDK